MIFSVRLVWILQLFRAISSCFNLALVSLEESSPNEVVQGEDNGKSL